MQCKLGLTKYLAPRKDQLKSRSAIHPDSPIQFPNQGCVFPSTWKWGLQIMGEMNSSAREESWVEVHCWHHWPISQHLRNLIYFLFSEQRAFFPLCFQSLPNPPWWQGMKVSFAAVPSLSCPGLCASHQARRRNTSVRSDGLTVIRVAAFGQQKHWAECLPVPARAVQFWITLKIHARLWSRKFLNSQTFSPFPSPPSLPSPLYFWRWRRSQLRFELSHVAVNWAYERKCILWLESARHCSLHMTHLVSCAEACQESPRSSSHLFDWYLGVQISCSVRLWIPHQLSPSFSLPASFPPSLPPNHPTFFGSWAKGVLSSECLCDFAANCIWTLWSLNLVLFKPFVVNN